MAVVNVTNVTCGGCPLDYWRFIKNFYGENDSFIEYLKAHGVLPVSVNCPDCDKECRYRKEKHLFVCGQWKKIAKTKRRKQCNYSVSLFKGTFLGKVLCRRGR